ncbi:MAG: ATPase, T2SS/T4P/T4SS family [Alphaproteobacteria bacterium]|nr:ATPase, T2SS/T4P/T4SS family [Alphaproteobacteria bacterium]
MSKKLQSLPFVDLYICLEGGETPHYHAPIKGRKKRADVPVPPEFDEDLQNLKSHLENSQHGDMGIVSYDGMRLRAVTLNTANGQKWVALRRIKDLPPPLATLGFPPALVPHLQALGKRTGLILVCGATGQGKTTTCCSMLMDFMQNQGGVAFTIEDPVEYDLAGRRGENGYCYQVEVREDRDWAEMLQLSLRCHPEYIFIGEVCTPDAANQLLRAATSGHLVIATVHAGNLQEGLEGLLQLAEQVIGERAKQLLASSLTAVIHQTLGEYGLTSTFLLTDFGSQSAGIRSIIRDNQIGQITSIVDKQYAQLMQNGQVFR